MPSRRWGVQTKGIFNSFEFITLTKLRHTVRSLKLLKGESYADNSWGSPIVPLLIEHVFMSTNMDLSQIDSITIDLNKGKDLKL